MRKEVRNIYQFSELSEAAKKVAIQKVQESDWYLNWDWSSFVIENVQERIEEQYGIKMEDVQFSGFWSQGDGASFTCTIDDPLTLLPYFGIKFNHDCLYDMFANSFIFTIEHNGRYTNYVHRNTVTAYAEINGIPDWEGKKYISNVMEKAAAIFKECLEAMKNDICNMLYKELSDTYDSYMKGEAIAKFLEDNEYEFLEDGTMI